MAISLGIITNLDLAGALTAGGAVTVSGLTTATGGLKVSTLTGILKGAAGTVSVATAGTDYVAGGAITTSGLTMATAKMLGRATAGTGAVEEISVTGSGNAVLSTSPTLTTPILGVATATSLTAPASTDLTLAGGSSGATLNLGQGASGAATLTSPKGGDALTLRNTNTNGYSTIEFQNSSSTQIGTIGNGNSSTGALANALFLNAATAAPFYFARNGTVRGGINTSDYWLLGANTANIYTSQAGAPSATQGEHFVRLTGGAGLNVATFQNTSTTGFSAVRFSDETGAEKSAFGYGNSGSGSPFASSTYIEASAANGSGTPGTLKFVQTILGTSQNVSGMFSTGYNLLIGGTSDITGTGGAKVFGTTAATNTTSGAVQIGTNIGLSGNAGGPSYFGGNLTTVGALAAFGSGTAGVEVRASGDGTATPYGYWWRSGTTYEASMQQVGSTGVLTLDVGRNSSWGGKFDIYTDTTRSVRFAKSLTTFDQITNFANALSASSSTVGALTIGNGTAATNVAIGGGSMIAGANVQAVGNINVGPVGSDFTTGRINIFAGSDTVPGLNFGGSNYGFGILEKTDGNLYFARRSGSTTNTTWLSVARASGDMAIASSSPSTGVGTGALQVAGGIYAGAASVFGGNVSVTAANADTVLLVTSGNAGKYAALRLGRTAAEGTVAVPGTAGQWSTNAVAGDLVFRLDSGAYRVAGASGTEALTISSANYSSTFGGITILKNYTVATLPAAASYTYGEAYVSDATQAAGTSLGSAPTGGGSVKRGVYSDGTNWLLR